jgi:hypothetical protein
MPSSLYSKYLKVVRYSFRIMTVCVENFVSWIRELMNKMFNTLRKLMTKSVFDWYISIYLSIYLSIYPSIYLSMALQSFVGPWPLFQFLNPIQSVGHLGRESGPSQGPLPIHGSNAQTPMHRVEFEPTIPVFERAKTVHALDHAATVIGC